MPVVTAVILALALVTVIWPAAVAAHPLGNFTTNRYSRIEFSEERVTITYVLDFAEIPTVQEMRFLDPDDDGTVTEAEKSGWLDERMPLIVKGLRLVVGDSVLPLGVESRSLELLPGQGGLQTLRLDTRLSTNLPDDWQRNGVGGYTDRNYQDRQGWREVVVQGGAGIEIASSSAPAVDLSNELRTYPDERLTDPLNQSEATFTIVPGTSTVATDTPGEAAENVREIGNGGRATDRVAALITVEQLSPKVIGLSLLLAMFWGAVHALSPGHGKTVVAAYLIGTRGTARHAAFLGLTVTITHTAGVFALGLVTLYLSRYILPEDLYPWLSVASGLFVVGIGPTLFRSRLRGNSHHDHHHHDHVHGHHHAHGDDHHHGPSHTHSHLPPGVDGTKVTWRSLLALGLSGGLIPCPSALVLLLGSISLDRLGLGMVLVTAFSLGLAAVLTAIGLLLVYSRHLFDRFSFSPRVPSALPALSALLVSIAGVAILVSALQDAGVL